MPAAPPVTCEKVRRHVIVPSKWPAVFVDGARARAHARKLIMMTTYIESSVSAESVLFDIWPSGFWPLVA
jgi:hypothetical protein